MINVLLYSSPHIPTPDPRNSFSRDKRDLGPRSPFIIHILVAKELNKQLLLPLDSRGEETPKHSRVRHEADNIAHDELRAESPPEEAKVRGVAQVRVHAGGDERVLPRAVLLDDVVEGRARLHHRDRAHDLAHDHHCQPRRRDKQPAVQRRPRAARPGDAHHQALERGGGVGDRVRGPVGRQQERLDVGVARVVRGRGPELEEVERRQRGEEEGQPPQRARRPRQRCQGQQHGEAERDPEAEGPHGDASQRLGLPGLVGPVRVEVVGLSLRYGTEEREDVNICVSWRDRGRGE